MGEPTNGGRAQAYQALRESEELHRATLSNISDAVFLTDDEGVFTFVCPRFMNAMDAMDPVEANERQLRVPIPAGWMAPSRWR